VLLGRDGRWHPTEVLIGSSSEGGISAAWWVAGVCFEMHTRMRRFQAEDSCVRGVC
jgi:hypothetical protein